MGGGPDRSMIKDLGGDRDWIGRLENRDGSDGAGWDRREMVIGYGT
jgi:hypothetical protein